MAEGGGSSLVQGLPLWADILLSGAVVLLSAYFAGTTLGIFTLDRVGLQILSQASDDAVERAHAKTILPVRERGNWLLTTLLIGNTIANSFLSILMAGYTSGVLGLILSTVLIVIFAEIIPQAFCSRHGLWFGAKTVWIIRVCMALLAPVAWPLAFILNKILGREVGNFYTRSELKHLIQMHVENPEHPVEMGLSKEDHQLLSGALDYKDKRVKDVMTPIERVYSFEASARLNFATMMEIYRSGYTRIPVYEKDPQDIIGILYTKDLILVDPDDELEIRTLVSFHGKANVQYILDITPLNEVFTLFKSSRTHMMLACCLKEPAPELPPGKQSVLSVRSQQNFLSKSMKQVTGVITLEDVLEEVIQDEIIDETDTFESNEHNVKIIRRPGRDRPDVSSYLALFEHKIRDQNKLSPPEVQAVSAFLLTAVPEFAIFASVETVLKGLVRQAEIMDTEASDSEDDDQSRSSGPEHQLYTRGQRSHHFTLVLQGRLVVHAGTEGFQSEMGPWSVLGTKALGSEPYFPDFDAFSSGGCRLMRIHAEAYRSALRMGKADRIVGVRAMRQLSQAMDIVDKDGSKGLPAGRSPPRTPAKEPHPADSASAERPGAPPSPKMAGLSHAGQHANGGPASVGLGPGEGRPASVQGPAASGSNAARPRQSDTAPQTDNSTAKQDEAYSADLDKVV